MKFSLTIALAAALALSGCSIFQRSPNWDSVVTSRSQYSGADDSKGGYLDYLHHVLQRAGIPHKLVTYQFHFHNAYREEGVQTAMAILYRDETTPSSPWWVMDEYRRLPVWLPNWELSAQLGFFNQRPVEVVSVKEFAGAGPGSDAKFERTPKRMAAHSAREKSFRALFTSDRLHPKAPGAARTPRGVAGAAPRVSKLAPNRTASADSATALFRNTHGTQFDPGSSIDRAKMNELRRQLLNRNQRISLRTQ